jgi:hypothetical protein
VQTRELAGSSSVPSNTARVHASAVENPNVEITDVRYDGSAIRCREDGKDARKPIVAARSILAYPYLGCQMPHSQVLRTQAVYREKDAGQHSEACTHDRQVEYAVHVP